MRKSFLLIASLLLVIGLTTSASAQTEWGLGFLYNSHPIGIFIQPNDESTIHIAGRFEMYDVPSGSTATETVFGVAGAYVYDFWSGSSWGFGVAPGVAFTNFSPNTGDSSSQTLITAQLKGHWEPVDMLSIWFGHGLVIQLDSPPVGDSTTDFYTTGHNLTELGFTVWAP